MDLKMAYKQPRISRDTERLNDETMKELTGKTDEEYARPFKQKDYSNMAFAFHSDAGHGWLAVPRDLLVELGIEKRISEYSYQSKSGQTVYLEEDADGTLFQNEYEKKFGKKIAYQSKDDGTTSPIRSYPAFKRSEF